MYNDEQSSLPSHQAPLFCSTGACCGMSARKIHTVAIIGAGASGAIALDALLAERVFTRIVVFERRNDTGGVWCFDPNPEPRPLSVPSAAGPEILDPPLDAPKSLPSWTPSSRQERFETTANYSTLSTNVPESAMTFSDQPKWPVRSVPSKYVHNSVVHQYLHEYFAPHTSHLRLGATVEEMWRDGDSWRIVYRQRQDRQDLWQQDSFDAVVLATGHYHIPFIPYVSGLRQFQLRHPERVVHSKHYRYQSDFCGKRVLLVGGRASARDLVRDLVEVCPRVLQSLRTPTQVKHTGVTYKPTITRFDAEHERVHFQDGSSENVDVVIYCTGYQFSFPFLNTPKSTTNDFSNQARVKGLYQHTFYIQDPTLCLVGTVIDVRTSKLEPQIFILTLLGHIFSCFRIPSGCSGQALGRSDQSARHRTHADLGTRTVGGNWRHQTVPHDWSEESQRIF